eukprot:TRINITY_DN113_c0_g1_i2.p1 TRINITY_DN113_c0_g1~~TRINITY_DN113_c0_g1_i2.p1  ORF type:complete len:498 (-),score=103.92 TRINITY_DN113_c0_g1_i2:1042-2535(-)
MDSVRDAEAAAGSDEVVFRRGSRALELTFDSGSFRDRTARVFLHRGEVYRALSTQALNEWLQVSAEPYFQQLLSSGKVVPTEQLSEEQIRQFQLPVDPAAILRHQRVPFVTYPYEWSFSMLQDAALLHLEILSEAIQVGTILKDSSPYNVQFCGSRPVFIDIGSFVSHAPGEPWSGYRQFCEMMLFPLLLQAYRNIQIQSVLRVKLDGISAAEFLRPLSWRDMFRPGVFTHGWLQSMLERQAANVQTDTIGALKSSGFDRSLIQNNLKQLTRLIRRLKWTPRTTQWSNYRHDLPHVVRDLQAKQSFVEEVCQARRRNLVWDLGCNDGHFSRIAAKHANTVIAMDQDHGCVERLYRDLVTEKCDNIVPLCIDLLNPSPALGWRGRERRRLESRGQPDLVLCLGLIHHLVIAGNIPLPEVVDWLSSFQADVVLEFPNKLDPMVKSLLRHKHDQYDDYSLEALESALSEHALTIQKRIELPSGHRTLLFLTSTTSPPGAA